MCRCVESEETARASPATVSLPEGLGGGRFGNYQQLRCSRQERAGLRCADRGQDGAFSMGTAPKPEGGPRPREPGEPGTKEKMAQAPEPDVGLRGGGGKAALAVQTRVSARRPPRLTTSGLACLGQTGGPHEGAAVWEPQGMPGKQRCGHTRRFRSQPATDSRQLPATLG